MELISAIKDLALGSVAGHLIERCAAPSLPGAFSQLPIRPIYGFGAALASESILRNCLVSMCLEQLIALRRPDLWHYCDNDGFLVTDHVKLENNILFGIAMKAYARVRDYDSSTATGAESGYDQQG